MNHDREQLITRLSRLPGSRAIVYAAEGLKFFLRTGASPRFTDVAFDYRSWRESRHQDLAPLDARSPWIVFAAVQYLESRLTPEMKVFEYGSGGSTVFFATRTAEVFSVEHDLEWSRTVTMRARSLGLANVTVRHVAPANQTQATTVSRTDDPDSYGSSDERYAGQSFREYVEAIDSYPDGNFNLVMVDGRARPSCVKHALRKIATNGVLMLDNSDRAEYSRAIADVDRLGWSRRDFVGGVPSSRQFAMTSVWERPRVQRPPSGR